MLNIAELLKKQMREASDVAVAKVLEVNAPRIAAAAAKAAEKAAAEIDAALAEIENGASVSAKKEAPRARAEITARAVTDARNPDRLEIRKNSRGEARIGARGFYRTYRDKNGEEIFEKQSVTLAFDLLARLINDLDRAALEKSGASHEQIEQLGASCAKLVSELNKNVE